MKTVKILVAEDDTNLRQGLVDLLQAEGYQVLAAENGAPYGCSLAPAPIWCCSTS